MIKLATISKDQKYRYSLTRVWDESKPSVMFIMLNPSTADHNADDPTIRRCISFAQSWGFGSLYVCNLFAFRSTDPKQLLDCEDPRGVENSRHILKISIRCEKVVCAWGNYPVLKKLGIENGLEYVTRYIPKHQLYILAESASGAPKHPLYLKKDLQPKPLFINTAANK